MQEQPPRSFSITRSPCPSSGPRVASRRRDEMRFFCIRGGSIVVDPAIKIRDRQNDRAAHPRFPRKYLSFSLSRCCYKKKNKTRRIVTRKCAVGNFKMGEGGLGPRCVTILAPDKNPTTSRSPSTVLYMGSPIPMVYRLHTRVHETRIVYF